MRDRVGARRAIAASAIVCAAVAGVPCIDAVVRGAGAAGLTAAPTSDGIDASALTSGADALAVIERIDGLVSGGAAELPEAFADEVGCPDGARNVQVSSTGRVVGCLLEGDEEAVMDEVERWLGDKGWTAVPLGSVVGATFVKGEGACTWMLVTCTQAGDDTSVVFRGDFL